MNAINKMIGRAAIIYNYYMIYNLLISENIDILYV